MTIDAIIFDIEGTLVDSVKQTLQCWHTTLLELGYHVPIEALQKRSGMDGNMMLEQLLPKLSGDERRKIIKAQGERFQKDYLFQVRPFEGVRDTLLTLRECELRFALATDCQGPALERYRTILQIDDLLDAIACGENAPEGKPNPELIDQAVKKLSISPSRAVMVGDTPFDAKAAQKSGVSCIGLLTGGHLAEALYDAGCKTVLDAISHLSPDVLSRPPSFPSRAGGRAKPLDG
jgi:HAD superfamily hydrolase (TIGR01509 family)